MGKTQFEKRQSKTVEEASKEVAEVLAAPDMTLPFTGFDVYSEDGNANFKVAELNYDPKTGEAKVINTFTISRLVGLQHGVQKNALGILKSKALKK